MLGGVARLRREVVTGQCEWYWSLDCTSASAARRLSVQGFRDCMPYPHAQCTSAVHTQPSNRQNLQDANRRITAQTSTIRTDSSPVPRSRTRNSGVHTTLVWQWCLSQQRSRAVDQLAMRAHTVVETSTVRASSTPACLTPVSVTMRKPPARHQCPAACFNTAVHSTASNYANAEHPKCH